jgi:hypothetical protein
MSRFATFTTLNAAIAFCASAWDLVRTLRPRIADPDAQVWIGEGLHVAKALSVAVRIAIPRQHPTDALWAVCVDKPGHDADIDSAKQFLVDRPGLLSLFDDGPQLTLPDGVAWPDGTTAPRPNYFYVTSQAATQTRWVVFRNKVDAAVELDATWRTVQP